RENRDGLKVGGHQASCASVAALMTALYFDVLRPGDRVAVKPHASPVYHAIQYLLGRQTRDKLERFRALGGAQAYPSRTKDSDGVDFSTGSVGLGAAMTLFASLTQDLLHERHLLPDDQPKGRMVAIVGDAELDEGNVFEALLEGWKHDIRNVWWVIDYNRQSLDRVVPERLFTKIEEFFSAVGWQVVILKYGKLLEAAFARPDGAALRQWIDDCPNDLYSALTFKGGAGWRERLEHDLGHLNGIRDLLAEHDDDELARLMTNLGGHDLDLVREAFQAVGDDDRPHCFIAYTIKGFRLPFAGHKDNHAGLMTPEQMAELKKRHRIPDGKEWDRFAGLDIDPDELQAFLERVPFAGRTEEHASAPIPVPAALPFGRRTRRASTQEAFGRLMGELARDEGELAAHIITTSPDVTVSTSLGSWVSRRSVFNRADHADVFKQERLASSQLWAESRRGQHVELGIAENNLFLMLAALGLSGPLFGQRLIPIGTLYDPFIARGLDALTYACYQDARFILVATPSGITLAPEGGAHQSVSTPLIGIGQPELLSFEPAYADELAEILRFAFEYIQSEDGSSVYLRLSTRPIEQPERAMTDELRQAILAGGYWLRPPTPGAELALVGAGAVLPELIEAADALADDLPGLGILVITSADRLLEDWRAVQERRAQGEATSAAIERLLAPLAPDGALVTVLDGHPATLAWLGSATGRPVYPLGVDRFGQSGDIPDLYRIHRIDAAAIIDRVALACTERARRQPA
ncbi:MAG TPA: 1-deoxy-D-xylulose-5-phosphate synthase N-terminal domain-containing protein, partial [Geminicoccaceae bacterium]|nr:1-deoxy-D-xylulose-5-phosphate synthase N-terminal domain-containing protein [Geminicoccaceae bacterium]